MATLEYAAPPQPSRSGMIRRAWLWLSGSLPSLVLLLAVMDNAVSGDPVDSLARFKAYHYASATVLLLALGWFVLIMRATSRRLRLAAFFAAAFWVIINFYWAYLFLRDVRSDIASTYYKTMWNPLGRWL